MVSKEEQFNFVNFVKKLRVALKAINSFVIRQK